MTQQPKIATAANYTIPVTHNTQVVTQGNQVHYHHGQIQVQPCQAITKHYSRSQLSREDIITKSQQPEIATAAIYTIPVTHSTQVVTQGNQVHYHHGQIQVQPCQAITKHCSS